MKYGFGVDLGGTTVKIAYFDETGKMLEKWEIPTDTSENGIRILPDIAASVRAFLTERKIADSDILGLGIGVPGPVNAKGVVNRCINLGWDVFNIAQKLTELTGFPVKAGNDANVAALGEIWMGCAKGCSSAVMVTLGTGVGGGILTGGRLLEGARGLGGELGHYRTHALDGVDCTCGAKGCWERYASASALTRETKAAMQADKNTIMWKMTQDIDHVNAKLAFDAAAKGDETARKVIDSWIEYVGVGIANVINTFEPEVICIGGGVSNQGEVLLAPVRAYAENETRNITTGKFPVICACQLHNDAGVIGAAALGSSI